MPDFAPPDSRFARPKSRPAGEARRGRYRPLVAVFLAAGAGILLDRFAAPPGWLAWLAVLAALAVWGWLWRRRRDGAAALVLLAAVLVTAGLWHHQRWQSFAADEIGLAARERSAPVFLEVVALGSPEHLAAPPRDPLRSLPQGPRSRLDVRVVAVRNGAAWQPASGKVSLSVEGQLWGVRAGDRLRVCGQLSAPAPAENPGEFDWRNYLRSERVLASVWSGYPACVTRIAQGSVSPRRGLDAAREYCRGCLNAYVPREQRGLALAAILGERGELGRDRSELFFETGTIHLLVVSGLHVGLVALFILLAGRAGLLSWRKATWAALAIALAYAAIAGFRPPAMRAALLVAIGGMAVLGARRVDRTNALAAAALAVLVWNPTELFRSGAQLSFLAVATLVVSSGRLGWRSTDPLDELIAATRPWPQRAGRLAAGWAGRLVWVSMAIWVAALPLVLYQFHLFTPLGMLLTPLVWIPICVALASGLVVVATGGILPPVAELAGKVCGGCLAVTEGSVRLAHEAPGSRLWTGGPGLWWVLGFYALLAWLMFAARRPPRRWRVALVAGWIAIGAGVAVAAAPRWQTAQDRGLTLGFVDVGHGTSVVIELPDGRTLLYDAGHLGTPEGGVRAISAYLWSRGINHLDAVVISHADLDHYNALPGLLERFGVGVVYVSPVMFREDLLAGLEEDLASLPPGEADPDSEGWYPASPALAALQRSLRAHEVPMRPVRLGDRLAGGEGVEIQVLHPPRFGVLGSDNANSIVLAIAYVDRRILLPGDLESPGLDDVLATTPLDCDLIMAPHHGSERSNPAGLAEWSRPEWVVISGGRSADTSAVEAAYRAAGAKVLETATSGAITVHIARGEMSVAPYRHTCGE